MSFNRHFVQIPVGFIFVINDVNKRSAINLFLSQTDHTGTQVFNTSPLQYYNKMYNVSSNHNPISVEKPPRRSPWAASVESNPTCVQTFPLEITFTDDLPNGPYGEITSARGELYVMHGTNYETVAEVLDATWMKYCKRDLNKYSDTRMDRRKRDIDTMNVENYRVIFIEFKGGICVPGQTVASGSHTCSVGRVLTLLPPSVGCCTIA